MSLEQFINESLSPWMREKGPDSDIVMSSRIRLARNFDDVTFPMVASDEELSEILEFFRTEYETESFDSYRNFKMIDLQNLSTIERRILVEKHLISPLIAKGNKPSATLVPENEEVSIMINEEDHIRLQIYLPGSQLGKSLERAFLIDDWLEEKVDYAFSEEWGYLTSCPTNVGTGIRASVMMHLPALVMTQQMARLIPAINQLGLVVRGIFGEGSGAVGNIFQISNQMTLGKSEEDIVEDLEIVVEQLIEQERKARLVIQEQSEMRLKDRIYRSYGTLAYSRILESKEAARCLSDLRLGIDLGIIEDLPQQILNELMILTQPGLLQHYAEKILSAGERDILRASLTRERLKMN